MTVYMLLEAPQALDPYGPPSIILFFACRPPTTHTHLGNKTKEFIVWSHH